MPASRESPEDLAARLRSAGSRLGPGWEGRPDLARHVFGDLLPEDPEGADALAAAAESGLVARLGAGQDLGTLTAELTARSSVSADLSDWSLRVWRAYAGGPASASPRAQAPGPEDRAETARRALQRGRAAAGEALGRDPVLARRVLGDLLPHDAAAVSVLVAAVRDGVPGRLAADLPTLPADLVLPRLTASLTERESIAPDRARWAVTVWAAALGFTDTASTLPGGALPESGEQTVIRGGVSDTPQLRPRAAPPVRDPAAETRRPAVRAVSPAPPGPPPPSAGGVRRRRIAPLIVAAIVLAAAALTGTWFATRPGVAAKAGVEKITVPATSATSATPAALPKLIVAAHRGGNERYAPETLKALLDAAGRPGVAAETDMRWTSDGVPVLIHDADVRAPMSCSGSNPHPLVASMTAAALRSDCATDASASPLGGRYPVPTVSEVAARIAATPGAQWLLEIKTVLTPKQEDLLFDTLQQNKIADRTVITSFFGPELAKARAEAKSRGISIRLLQFVPDTKLSPATAKQNGLWAVAMQDTVLSKAYVDGLHENGVTALEWTVNTTAQWQQAADAGIDLVVTDEPIDWQKWNASR